MAGRLELRPDLRVVVDLAVEDDPDAVVFVGQRLLTGGEVDDAEPPVRKPGEGVAVEARFVGTAMGDARRACAAERATSACQAIGGDDPGNAAQCRVPRCERFPLLRHQMRTP